MESSVSKRTVTAEALVDLAIPSRPRFSPSGKHVLYQTAARFQGDHTSTRLWLARSGHNNSAAPLSSTEYDDREAEWRPNPKPDSHSSESFAFLSDRADRGKSCAIYLSSSDSGIDSAKPLTDPKNLRGISDLCWSPDGEYIAYASADEESKERRDIRDAGDQVNVYGQDLEVKRLRIVHVSSGKSRPLFDFDWATLWTCAWSPDSSKILFTTSRLPELNSPLDGVDFFVVDVASGHLERICQFPGAVRDPYWTPSGIYFLAGASPGKCQSSIMLYRLLLDSSTWQGVAYGERNCLDGIRPLGDAVVVKVLENRRTSLQHVDESGVGGFVHEAIHELASWDVSPDPRTGKTMTTFVASCYENTPNVWVRTQGTDDWAKLSSHGSDIETELRSRYLSLPVDCRSRDGTTDLEANFLRPRNTAKGSALSTLVFVHGGPYMRSENSFDPTIFRWAPMLVAQRKHAILFPNYRGGQSRGEAFAAAARGALGTVDYEDVISLVEEGIHRGLVDKHRVMIGGWSQGGFMSYISAVRNAPNKLPRSISDWQFKGAICGAGICDDDMLTMSSDMPTFQAELSGIAPWDAKQDDTRARRASAIWQLTAGVKHVPPILILHGEADERVPLSQAIAFHRGCQRHNIPCELVTYPKQPHVMTRRAYIIDMLHRVPRFIDTCLGS